MMLREQLGEATTGFSRAFLDEAIRIVNLSRGGRRSSNFGSLLAAGPIENPIRKSLERTEIAQTRSGWS